MSFLSHKHIHIVKNLNAFATFYLWVFCSLNFLHYCIRNSSGIFCVRSRTRTFLNSFYCFMGFLISSSCMDISEINQVFTTIHLLNLKCWFCRAVVISQYVKIADLGLFFVVLCKEEKSVISTDVIFLIILFIWFYVYLSHFDNN